MRKLEEAIFITWKNNWFYVWKLMPFVFFIVVARLPSVWFPSVCANPPLKEVIEFSDLSWECISKHIVGKKMPLRSFGHSSGRLLAPKNYRKCFLLGLIEFVSPVQMGGNMYMFTMFHPHYIGFIAFKVICTTEPIIIDCIIYVREAISVAHLSCSLALVMVMLKW